MKFEWFLLGLGILFFQHLPRGADYTLRDGELTPFRNYLAPKMKGPGCWFFMASHTLGWIVSVWQRPGPLWKWFFFVGDSIRLVGFGEHLWVFWDMSYRTNGYNSWSHEVGGSQFSLPGCSGGSDRFTILRNRWFIIHLSHRIQVNIPYMDPMDIGPILRDVPNLLLSSRTA